MLVSVNENHELIHNESVNAEGFVNLNVDSG